MALRRILPSRVAPPEGSPAGEPANAPVITTPATAPEAPASPPPPVAAPKADLAALGALMAEDLPVAAPSPTPAKAPETAPVAAPETSPAIAEVAPPAPQPEAPAAEPSQPDENPLRRRPKQPRAFTYTAVPETAAAVPEAAPSAAAPDPEPSSVANPVANPVADTTPLSQVDDRLQEAGVLPTPVADELTSTLPPAPMASMPAPEVGPLPAPAPFEAPAPAMPAAEPQPPAQLQPEPAPAPAPEAAAPTSDLPWVTAQPSAVSAFAPAQSEPTDWFGNWSSNQPVGAETSPEATLSAPSSPMPTPDLYGSIGAGNGNGGGLPPPEIIGQFPERHGRSGGGRGGMGTSWQVGLAAAVVAAALFGAYQLVNKDSRSQLTQLSGTPENAAPAPAAPLLPPQLEVSPSNLFAGTGMEGMGTPTGASSSAVIAFTDVPPDQAVQPIVADGTEKMPDDVGFVARLQGAIEAEKARKEGGLPPATPGTPSAAAPADVPLEQKRLQGEDLRAQLAEELAAYRKALAESPSKMEAPKPGEFLGQQKKYMDGTGVAGNASATSPVLDSEGAPVQTPNGSLLPPPQLAGGNAVPPEELYKNNPNNLPVVPEPTAAAPAKVRQLTDFDVAMFSPERDRIRIPSGIKPHFSTSGFPELDVLSFVPGKGIIAFKDGKEGVLLIGESVDGWELSAVNPDNAEFKNGQRTQYVTAE